MGWRDQPTTAVVAIERVDADEIGLSLEVVHEAIEKLVVVIRAVECYPVRAVVEALGGFVVAFVGITGEIVQTAVVVRSDALQYVVTERRLRDPFGMAREEFENTNAVAVAVGQRVRVALAVGHQTAVRQVLY